MSPVTKILFLTASPSDKAALQLDEEMRLIGQRIRRGEYRNLFEMRTAPAIRATDLPFELMDNAPEVVHFSGHGSKTGALYFIHDGDRTARPIPPRTLARVFKQFRDRVKCVVLNACYSAAQAEAIAESIPCVVGMSRAVYDSTAIAFAAGFYEALAFGKSVAEAFELGLTQVELSAPSAIHETEIPQLIVRKGEDASKIRLLPPQPEESKAQPQVFARTQPEEQVVAVSDLSPKRPIPTASSTAKSSNEAAQRKQTDTTVGPSDRKLTWLHVSDLHFGHGDAHYRFDQSGVTSAIIRNAESMAKRIGPPDLIFVTGDIAFSGQAAQYALAKEWLGRLRSIVGGNPRLFLVPGNHDVDRKLAMKTSAAALHQVLRADPRKLDELLNDDTEMQPLWPKLRAYSDFATDAGSPSMSADKPFYVEDVSCRLGGKLRIAGLNTALLSFDNDDSPKNLSLGRGQLLKAIEEQPTDALLLVLEHHPQEWLIDGKALVAQLQQRAHIQFSGHVHNQHGVVHMPLLGGSRLQFVAGAGHKDQSEEGYHSYAWGQLSEEGLAYYSWVWQPERMAFALATMIETDDFKRDDHAFVERARLPKSLRNWLSTPSAQSLPTPPAVTENPIAGAMPKRGRRAAKSGKSTQEKPGKTKEPEEASPPTRSTPPLSSPALDRLKEEVRKVLQDAPELAMALAKVGYGATSLAAAELVESVWAALSQSSVADVAIAVTKLAKQSSVRDSARQLLCHILPLAAQWQALVEGAAGAGCSGTSLELPLQTATIAEVVMAHLDARCCEFTPGRAYPQGTRNIPMPAVAHAALFDPQGSVVADAVVTDLWQERKMGDPPLPDVARWRAIKSDNPSEHAFRIAAKAEIKVSALLDKPRYLLFIDGDLDPQGVLKEKGELDAAWKVQQQALQKQLPGLRLVRLKGGTGPDKDQQHAEEIEIAICVREVHPS